MNKKTRRIMQTNNELKMLLSMKWKQQNILHNKKECKEDILDTLETLQRIETKINEIVTNL